MLEFNLRKTIKSCHVTKELIQDIESYIFNDIPGITQIPNGKILEGYTVSIKDKIGEEVLPSIANYRTKLFPDSIKSISLNVYTYEPPNLRIRIDFEKEKIYSLIWIEYKSENPREVVTGIHDAIISIIDTQKTINKVFYPHFIIDGLLYTSPILFFLIAAILFKRNLVNFAIVALIISTCLMYYGWIGKLFYPYVSFESNLYKKKKKWADRVFLGFISIVILETVAALLRKKIFGF